MKMKIRKGSWHHKLYMFGSKMFDDKGNADYTNLCSYVRRATLNVFLVALGMAVFWVFVCIVIAIMNLVTIPLGFGVAGPNDKNNFLCFPFEIKRKYGKDISLAWFAIPFWVFLGFGTLIWHSMNIDPIGTIGFFEGITIGILALAIIVMVILTGIAVTRVVSRLNKKPFFSQNSRIAEAVHLAKEYIKAKKEGICPLVEFVDEPEQPESEPQPQS